MMEGCRAVQCATRFFAVPVFLKKLRDYPHLSKGDFEMKFVVQRGIPNDEEWPKMTQIFPPGTPLFWYKNHVKLP